MATTEERWLAAWHLLSLDRARPFFGDLWIQFEREDQFAAELRSFIEPALKTGEYPRAPGALHYQLAGWFIEKYGRAGYASLRAWMFDIFLHGGPDRMPEKVWSSLVQHVAASGPRDRAGGSMEEVRAVLNRLDDDLASRMEARSSSPVSPWDRKMLPIYSSNVEAIDTEIRLISSYNNFLLAWSQVCAGLTYDQLREIDARGRAVASEVGWRDQDVPFPGNWTFDLAGLIDAAAAGTVISRSG
jgi:hypothetical protein